MKTLELTKPQRVYLIDALLKDIESVQSGIMPDEGWASDNFWIDMFNSRKASSDERLPTATMGRG